MASIAVDLDPLGALATGGRPWGSPVASAADPTGADGGGPEARRPHERETDPSRPTERRAEAADAPGSVVRRRLPNASARPPKRTHGALAVRALTLEASFRPNDPTARAAILALPTGPSFRLDGPRVSFLVPTPAGDGVAVADLSRLGIEDASRRLVHLVGTVRDDWACLYVEGALAGTARLSGADREWSVPLRPPAHDGFAGEVPLRRLYARALTGREVLKNHGASRPGGGAAVKGAMWTSRGGRRQDGMDEDDAVDAVIAGNAGDGRDGTMAIAKERDGALNERPAAPSGPPPANPFGNGWGMHTPVVATAVSAGPLPSATRAATVGPASAEPASVESGSTDIAADVPRAADRPPARSGGSAAAARERAAAALRMLRERKQPDPARAGPAPPRSGREADERPVEGPVERLEERIDAVTSDPSAKPPLVPSSDRETINAGVVGEPNARARHRDVAGDDTAPARTVRPGDQVRIVLPDATGCMLRGAVAYWPSALPDWLSLDRATGTVSGTAPKAGDAIVPVAVIASNGRGATATLSLTLAVESVEVDIDRREAAEAWEAVESAMRSTLDAIPALRERIEKGSRSGRIRLRAS